MRGLFEEPFDAARIAAVLQDERFFFATYVVAGHQGRWYACVEQLPGLFGAFMTAQLPDLRLHQLAALFWRWAGRLPDRRAAREHLLIVLDFIPPAVLGLHVARQLQVVDGKPIGWLLPPWLPR
jgi:hypothetical protein